MNSRLSGFIVAFFGVFLVSFSVFAELKKVTLTGTIIIDGIEYTCASPDLEKYQIKDKWLKDNEFIPVELR